MAAAFGGKQAPPFGKKASASTPDSGSGGAASGSDVPAFAKKKSFGKKRGRKTGKVAPAQKSLMASGRSMSR